MTLSSLPGVPQAPEAGIVIRICPNTVLAALVFLSLLLTAWLGTLAAAGFMAASLAFLIRRPAVTGADLLRFWPVLAVPGWCLLSWFWSNEPQVTLRYGIQLVITVAIAIAMATRLSPRNYVFALFAAYGYAVFASLAFGQARSDGSWLGIFASKNEFAFTMSVFVMLSFAVAIDRRVGQPTRAFGILGLPVGLFMLVMGQSTGALVSSLAVLSLGTVLALFRYVPSFGRLLLTVLSILAMAAILLVAWSFRAEIQSAFLGATGKDMTLTGRTELWEVAFGEIARHPLLGQGFKAVWVPGNPVAEEMWARFGISSKSGFHFHSTWISNTVEIGLLGIAIEAAAFLATLVLVSRWAIAAPSVGSIFFAMFAVQQAMLSFVEVVAYDQFQNGTIMLVSVLVFGWRFRTETVQAPVAARRSLGYGSRAGI